MQVLGLAGAALALYGFSTLAWIWALQYVEISKVYPYFALAFIIVPGAGYLVFGEVISVQYIIGIVMITGGVILTASS